MQSDLLQKIQSELERNSSEEYRDKIGNYFKVNVSNYLGVRLPVVRKIGNKYFKEIKDSNIDDVFDICDELLSTKVYENKVIAFQWSYNFKKQFQKKHFRVFERWLKEYINGWGDCDDLCAHSFGSFIFSFPEYLPDAKKWAASKSRWLRRASAVVLIYSLKKKQHLKESFETALILLEDEDDLVQKGYGWMLKEASKAFQKEVFEFVVANKENMPRTALRYAIEKMPANYRKEAMK